MYWTNQYNNRLIQESYFSLAEEILSQYPQTETIYIPVSTCGTISGVSTWIKKQNPQITNSPCYRATSSIWWIPNNKQYEWKRFP